MTTEELKDMMDDRAQSVGMICGRLSYWLDDHCHDEETYKYVKEVLDEIADILDY